MRLFAARLYIGLGWIVGVTIGSFGGSGMEVNHISYLAPFNSKVI
jgi:hypothetical protein